MNYETNLFTLMKGFYYYESKIGSHKIAELTITFLTNNNSSFSFIIYYLLFSSCCYQIITLVIK